MIHYVDPISRTVRQPGELAHVGPHLIQTTAPLVPVVNPDRAQVAALGRQPPSWWRGPWTDGDADLPSPPSESP